MATVDGDENSDGLGNSRPDGAADVPVVARRQTDDEIFAAMVAGYDTSPDVGAWHTSENVPADPDEPVVAEPTPPPPLLLPPRPASITPWRARVVRPADEPDLFTLDDDLADDEGEDVIPPLPPAHIDPFTVLCWVMLLGGIVTLLVSGLTSNVIDPGWQLVACVALVCGFGTLVYRMRDTNGTEDGDNNGAVV